MTLTAYPPSIVEHTIRHFLQQWFMGLQPSLHLVTRPDGVIYAKSEVNRFSSNTSKYNTQLHTKNRRRSGRGAKLLRKLKRSENMQQINTDDILTSGMGDVMTRNCVILNEGVDTDTSALDKQPCKPSCVDAAVQAVCDTADALCEPILNL